MQDLNDTAGSEHRVVSISPTDMPLSPAAVGPSADDVLIAPRVLDETAYNTLGRELRELIEQSSAAAGQLQKTVDETAESRGQSAKASATLHERLRLSARMLKAFQSQIDLVQASLDELETSRQETKQVDADLEAKATQFESRLQTMLEKFTQRADEAAVEATAAHEAQLHAKRGELDELDNRITEAETRLTRTTTLADERINSLVSQAESRVETAIHDARSRLDSTVGDAKTALSSCITETQEQLDSSVNDARDRVDSLLAESKRSVDRLLADTHGRVDTYVDDAQRWVDSLGKVIERAEKNAAQAATKSAEAAKRVDQSAADGRAIVKQCDKARKVLADELIKATEQVDAAAARSAEICTSVQTGRDDLESTAQRLEECLADIKSVAERREQLEHTCRVLEQLLQRLGPWQAIVETTADPTDTDGPHPLIRLIDDVRSGLGRDAARLANTMHRMAGRLDELLQPTPNTPNASDDVDDENDPPLVEIDTSPAHRGETAPEVANEAPLRFPAPAQAETN